MCVLSVLCTVLCDVTSLALVFIESTASWQNLLYFTQVESLQYKLKLERKNNNKAICSTE